MSRKAYPATQQKTLLRDVDSYEYIVLLWHLAKTEAINVGLSNAYLKRAGAYINQNTVDQDSPSGYGPMISANRLVRTRSMLVEDPGVSGVVWGLGAKHLRLPD